MKLLPLLATLSTLSSSIYAEDSSLTFEPVDPERDRTVPVRVYLPETSSPAPVVLFSHGLGGSRDNNTYLGSHWAGAGYVAVFLQHIGSDESVWKEAAPAERFEALSQAANLKSTLDRFADVPFVIDQLEIWNGKSDHPLSGRLNLESIGLSGHSYGAVTTQALMGQSFPGGRTVSDPRIDAFVLMSPSAPRLGNAEKSFADIASPVLCMTGTKDGSPLDPDKTPESRLEVYAAIPSGDKYQVNFFEGNHFLFGDGLRKNKERIEHHHEAVLMLTTHFWNAYLKGDSEAKTWLQSDEPKRDPLESADTWEWK